MKEDYKFFLGKGNTELREDELQLDVPDEYEGLTAKVQAIFKWALDRNYDYICKIDDDVYIYPDKLIASDYSKHHYVGRLNKWKTPLHPKSFLSGFTYWISAYAARLVVDSPLDPLVTFEDRWVGGVLGRAGIEGYNDRLYKVMSLFPKHQWYSTIQQNYGALCQFEPDELRFVHDIATGKVIPPPPPTRAPRQVTVRNNPKLFRTRRR
jgi:glycosyltransferase involved in cell wall biosynthesis